MVLSGVCHMPSLSSWGNWFDWADNGSQREIPGVRSGKWKEKGRKGKKQRDGESKQAISSVECVGRWKSGSD